MIKKEKIKNCFVISMIVGIACAIIRTCAYIFDYDADIGYFKQGSIFITSLYIILLTAFIFTIVIAVLLQKSTENSYEHDTGINSRSASIFAIAALLIAVINFCKQIFESNSPQLIDILGLIFSVFAAYHFVVALCNDKKIRIISIFTGYVVPFAFCLSIADIYFNMYITMNHPDKVALIMVFILFMMYYLYEIRILIGRALPRVYVLFSLLSVILGVSVSLSYMTALILGIVGNGRYKVLMPYMFIILLFTMHIIIRFAEYVHHIAAFADIQTESEAVHDTALSINEDIDPDSCEKAVVNIDSDSAIEKNTEEEETDTDSDNNDNENIGDDK